MTYLRVKWLHQFSQHPILLFSELDDQRFEIRKVEVFHDGRQEFANENEEYGGTGLGVVPTLELDELAANPVFEPELIAQSEFEMVWAGRLGKYVEQPRWDTSI